jgi:hypothetical protein
MITFRKPKLTNMTIEKLSDGLTLRNSLMKSLIVFLLVTMSRPVLSQSLPVFSDIPLTQATDYRKAEPAVLQASVYILTTPYSKEDNARLLCVSFILKWMTGTPDYNFTFGESATKVLKDDANLLSVYVAAMAMFSLENPDLSKDTKAVGVNAMTTVLTYCNDPANNMKMTKPMKKLWEAKQEGKLAEELN